MKKNICIAVFCTCFFGIFAADSGVPELFHQQNTETKKTDAPLIVQNEKTKAVPTEKPANASDQLPEILSAPISEALLKNMDEKNTAQLSALQYNEKNMQAKLLPNADLARKVFSKWQHETCVFMMENLYLYKKPSDHITIDDTTHISNILHSVSTMEGIEYYSTSRKKMRTLYEKSYAVQPRMTKKKKTSWEKAPDDLTAQTQLVLQKDLTFGEFIYQYSYYAENNCVSFVCENTEKLMYGIFSLVNPYEMNVSLLIFDLGDYVLAYANTRANFARLPGIEKKLKNSFSSRADALYQWFITSYEKK